MAILEPEHLPQWRIRLPDGLILTIGDEQAARFIGRAIAIAQTVLSHADAGSPYARVMIDQADRLIQGGP